jgi:hypothetical protein
MSVVSGLASAGCESVDVGSQGLGAEFRVETWQEGDYFEVSLNPGGAQETAEDATGAVLVPFLDANGQQYDTAGHGIRGTCGVTFISSSHAITAAHCLEEVDVPDPVNQTFTVEMYNVSSNLKWQQNDHVVGTWPHWSSPLNGLGPADGYNVEEFACKLTARCGTSWGPMIACNFPDADIALLECQGDPGTKYGYMNVATSDSWGDEVFMPWKHEVLDVDPGDPEHWDHYIDRPYTGPASTYQNNFHYYEEGQLLPLRSKPFPNGSDAPKITSTPGPVVTYTNLFGCHGTSGSGILKQGSSGLYELLGPVAAGLQLGDYLCHQSDEISPTTGGMGYAARDLVAAIADQATCGAATGNLLLWLWCHLKELPEEAAPFDPPLTWPCLTCPPFDWMRVVNEPLVAYPAGEPQMLIPFGRTQSALTYRVSVHAMPLEGSLDQPIQLLVDGEPVDSLELDEQTGKLSASFTARHDAVDVAVAYRGELPVGITELSRVVDGEVNELDTMVDRAGLGLLDAEGALAPMRFGPDGNGGFAAELWPGESMAITRQAFVRGVNTWRLALRAHGELERLNIVAYDGLGRQEPIEGAMEIGDDEVIVHFEGVEHPAAIVASYDAGEAPIAIHSIAITGER